MSISVSEELHSYILERTNARFHSSVSEYMRYLVRRDKDESERPPAKAEIPSLRTANQCMEDARRAELAEYGLRQFPPLDLDL